MSDFYSTQFSRNPFTASLLTATYADTDVVIETKGMTKLAVAVAYAMGAAESANKVMVKLEQSPDNGVTWFPLSIDSTTTVSALTNRVWEFTGDGSFDFVVDIAYQTMRLSLAESGVSANAGNATVWYTLSGE